MKIRFTKPSERDLSSIEEYITQENPAAAIRTVLRILNAIEWLAMFPYMGRPGLVLGTRELVISGTPYIAVYFVSIIQYGFFAYCIAGCCGQNDGTYWVVFELAVPKQHQSADFGKATVQYFDTFARQNQKPQFALSPKGQITPQWVTQHALGLWTSEVASYALYDVEANDLATAEKRIQAHISVLETARTHLTPKTPAASVVPVKLVDDIITLTKFLSLAQNLNQEASAENTRMYLNYGLKELDSVRNGFLCGGLSMVENESAKNLGSTLRSVGET